MARVICDLPTRAMARIEKTAVHCARVAELADALDSGFQFWRFFRVAIHHFKLRQNLESIGQNRF
jgi:hypothetical protein